MKKWIPILLLLAACVCFADPVMFSFNAGELGPKMRYRVDQVKYYSGAQQLENMLPLPQGTVIRRPGTKFIATTKTNTRVRLIPFEFSTTDTFILEFGNLYIRFYKNGAQTADPDNSAIPLEIVTPYTTAQLRDIQFIQVNDVMFMTHPSVHPQKLSRLTNTSWTIENTPFSKGPFTDENTTDTTINPSDTTGSITLTASTDTFNANHVGSLWKLIHIKASDSIAGALGVNPPFTSDEISVKFNQEWEFKTHGNWNGTVTLQKNYNNEGWLTEYPIDSENDDNAHAVGFEEQQDAQYRVSTEGLDAGEATYSFIIYTHPTDGVVTIDSITTNKIVEATVVATLGDSIATKRWSEGGWNSENGFPRAIGLFQQRAVYGGTLFDPTTLWLSASAGDYENMFLPTKSPDDDDPIIYTVASARQNPIQWVLDSDNIMVGTNGGVIQVGVLDSSEAVTGSNIMARTQSGLGSAHIRPERIEDAMLFVERNGARVRRLAYSLERDSYVNLDMTILAEHFFDSAIVEWAVQNNPIPILWCVFADGTFKGMTYQQEHDVIAWHTHPMGGASIESVAVIPSQTGEDEVWIEVQRPVSGSPRFIEQLQPHDWGSDNTDAWFLDSALLYEGVSTTTITGLTHLKHQVVRVFGEGGTTETVNASGEITLETAVTKALVGLEYTSKLETMPIEARGQTLGQTKRITEACIVFFDSIDAEYGFEGGTLFPIKATPSLGILNAGLPSLVNGPVTVPFHGNNAKQVSLIVQQSKPYPLGISAITSKVLYGR